MNNLELNFIVSDETWLKSLPEAETVSAAVMEQVFAYVSPREKIDFLKTGKPIIVNLSLSNDEEIQALNRNFRRMDKPTNVLSFANIDDEDFGAAVQAFPDIELGDIMIARETMEKEAAEAGISLHDHYCHLLTHGLLHLLGFDHQQDDEAARMEAFEAAILQQLNIKNPYEE